MIVELAGAPGSGKSALVEAVGCWLSEGGLRVVPREAALASCWLDGGSMRATVRAALRFAVRYPALVRHVVAGQARPVSRGDRLLALRRFFRDGAHHQLLARLAPGEAVVVSEGLVQRVVGLYVTPAGSSSAEAVTRYAKLLPPAAAVVLVRAPHTTCVERVLRRGLPRRLKGAERSAVAEFVASASAAVEMACRVLADRGEHVVALDNGASIEVTLGQLAAAVPPSLSPAAGRCPGRPRIAAEVR